ncbi:MAG TPA: alpha/beta fold hydrolase [Anaerolineae bacterium]|nr:alpha/beta fold hydrolase [Anaerolineae bacterium]
MAPNTKYLLTLIFAVLLLTNCQTDTPTPLPPTEPSPTTQSSPTTQLSNSTIPAPTPPPKTTPTTQPTPVPSPTSTPTTNLTTNTCPFDTTLISHTVTCYTITLPEDHNEPDNGRSITLPLAIFNTNNPNPHPDPILYLAGGPGENALQSTQFSFNILFAPYLQNRDLIIFDQRGTGYATPSLDCPEVKQTALDLLDDDLSLDATNTQINDSYTTCYQRLTTQDVNFAVYNSAQSAADVAALRQALNLPPLNLYAVSYGTRLAQTILRDHPQTIRAVILDSAYPIEANLPAETPANLQRAIDIFFTACTTNTNCNTHYPNLETRFWNLVDTLNQQPIFIPAANILTGDQYNVRVDGTTLLGHLFTALYQPDLLANFPQLIADLEQNQTDLLTRLISISISQIDLLSFGMQLSVQCYEENFFTSPAELTAALEPYPHLQPVLKDTAITGQLGLDLCQKWTTATPPPIENEPVTTNIPTLIIHGQHDPITPPHWGQQIAANFTNAFFYEFPGQGHGPGLTAPCAITITLNFLDQPRQEPDDPCRSQMTFAFTTPSSINDITLIPYTDGNQLFTSLVPDGWLQAGPGIYTDNGTVAILQQAVPNVSANILATLFSGQLGLDSLPDPITEQTTPYLTWTIYQFSLNIPGQGQTEIDFAVAETDTAAYLILLQAPPNQYENHHTAVFLPALDAFQP